MKDSEKGQHFPRHRMVDGVGVLEVIADSTQRALLMNWLMGSLLTLTLGGSN